MSEDSESLKISRTLCSLLCAQGTYVLPSSPWRDKGSPQNNWGNRAVEALAHRQAGRCTARGLPFAARTAA